MNIIQTFSTGNLPEPLRLLSEKIRRLNPTWNYMFFTDNDIRGFFRKKASREDRQVFEKLSQKIQQLDFFRYVVVEYYGGVYLDMDMEMTAPFDQELDLAKCYFPQEKTRNTDPFLLEQGIEHLVGNYAFYAPKGHPFLRHLITNISQPRISEDDLRRAQHNQHPLRQQCLFVYFTTGPILVTQTHADHPDDDVQLLSVEPAIDNQFGKYGRHLLMGTWKRVQQNKI